MIFSCGSHPISPPPCHWLQ